MPHRVRDTGSVAHPKPRQVMQPEHRQQKREPQRIGAIEEFAWHLRAGSHLVIAGSKHEILQEQDRFRAQFWAAFDAFVPGTPLFG